MTKKALAMALALVLCLSLLPSGAWAAFSDVPSDAWYSDAVTYVNGKGIMTGVSSSEFNPGTSMTRAQMCQILYNMEGKPGTGSATFTDVSQSDWFCDAVVWAASNGIVNGVGNNSFAPGNLLSREQTATLLYRYAQYKDYDVSGTVSLDAFSDAAQISSWAMTAMQWAVGERYISGTSGTTLTPGGTATRAQIAVIIMRFCQKADAYAEFKAKDIDDFDGYEIINWDNSNETNFAVITKSAIKVEATKSANILVSTDDEAKVYVFSNIDENISQLKPGDILYYIYGDDCLMLKIGSIELSGSQAVITAAEGDISDFYEYVDIDMSIGLDYSPEASLSDAQYSIEEQIAYDNTIEFDPSKSFRISRDFLSGEVSSTLHVKIVHYGLVADEVRASIESVASIKAEIKKNFTGWKDTLRIELPVPDIPTIPGLSIVVDPYFVFNIDASVSGTIEAKATSEIGVYYVDGEANPIKESKTELLAKTAGKVSVKAGVGMELGLKLLGIVGLTLDGEAGVKLDAKVLSEIGTNKDVKHLCLVCCDGELSAYASLDFRFSIVVPLYTPNLVDTSWPLADFYISLFNDDSAIEFGWGECPHKQYLVTAKVVDPNNAPVSSAKVVFLDVNGSDTRVSDSQGVATSYCNNGTVSIEVTADGYKLAKKDLTVESVPASVTIKLGSDSADPNAQYIRIKRIMTGDLGTLASIDILERKYYPSHLPFYTFFGEYMFENATSVYSYDSNGRLVKETIQYKNGTEETLEYTYDSSGKLMSESYLYNGKSSEAVYSYDSNGNAIEVKTYENNNFSYTRKYTYDSSGRLLTAAYADYLPDNYEYDSSGYLISCTDGDSYGCYFTNDSTGRILSIGVGPGYKLNYTYDIRGNVDKIIALATIYPSVNWGKVGEWNYTYDSHGNLTSVVYTSSEGESASVTYEYELR